MGNDKKERFSLKKAIGLPLIESAGGLVCNDDNCILMIFKRGKWDLPKGRVEGDDYQTAALREVNEESGLNEDKLEITGGSGANLAHHASWVTKISEADPLVPDALRGP